MGDDNKSPEGKEISEPLTAALEALEKLNGQRKQNAEYQLESHKALIKNPKALAELFGHYSKHDSWLLFEEALPISVGARPSEWTSVKGMYTNWLNTVEPLVRSSAGISLPVINQGEKQRLWRVKPKDFVQWLHCKDVPLMPGLETALGLEFKKVTSKKTETYSDHLNAEHHAQKRQKVLEAALAVLAAHPEKCQKSGKVSPTAIARIIDEKSPIWFGEGDIPLSERGVRDLIATAIKTLQ